MEPHTMTQSIEISLQIDATDADFQSQLSSNPNVKYFRLETSRFDGQADVITLVVTLTPVVLAFLGKVITEQLKSRKNVKIIYKGTQVSGVSEKNAQKILQDLLDNETK